MTLLGVREVISLLICHFNEDGKVVEVIGSLKIDWKLCNARFESYRNWNRLDVIWLEENRAEFEKKWTQLEIESESLRTFQLSIDKVTLSATGVKAAKTIDCAGVIDDIVEPQSPCLARSAFTNLCHFNQREAL